MPKDIQEPLRAANDQFTPWEPSPKQLAALSREWASLPPATDKDVRRGDVAYAQVQFTLATPERYAEVFPRQDGVVKDVLAQSAFGMQIVESYRALPNALCARDRKSTRLNSSHRTISYAVFCLKKKKRCQRVRRPDVEFHLMLLLHRGGF